MVRAPLSHRLRDVARGWVVAAATGGSAAALLARVDEDLDRLTGGGLALASAGEALDEPLSAPVGPVGDRRLALVARPDGDALDPDLGAALIEAAAMLTVALRSLTAVAPPPDEGRLFASIRHGAALCQPVFDGERMVDWVYLRVNDAFVRLTRLADVVGRRASEVTPGLHAMHPGLLVRYAHVVATGQSMSVSGLSIGPALGLHLSAYREDGGRFVLLFDIQDERLELRSALATSERWLRAMFEQAAVGIALVAPGGELLRVNRRLCTLLGFTEDELRGMSYRDISAPEHAAEDRDVHDDLRTGRVREVVLERQVVRKDGSRSWQRITLSRVDLGSDGSSLVAICEDLTAQRQAVQGLAASEARFRAVFEHVGIGIGVAEGPGGRLVEVNPKLCEILGRPRHALVGARRAELTHPDEVEVDRRLLAPLFTGEIGAVTREKRYLRPDGQVIWARTTVTRFDDGERETPVVALVEDITDRHRAEAALRESEARYRSVVDSLDDLVFTLDAAARCDFVNRAVAAFDYRPEDLLGQPLLGFVHPDDRPIALELLTATCPPPRELRLLDGRGRVRAVRVTLRSRATAAGGRVTGVVVDLTARRETEDQLRAAQKMEAVGRLAGGVAHDFNNLLSVILSYTELALDELREADPLRADLAEVLAAGRRAEGLTRQLLAFSRRQLLTPEPTDLPALVAGLGRMLERLIGEDIELVIAETGPLPPITIDRGQIEQVIMNLVVNARDAMPDGGRVTIATRALALDPVGAYALELPPGPYLELAVIDNGCGMDEEVRQRVFEPFFTTKGVGKGTGLGLSMAYGIVRQSGGALAVASAPDEGATFRVFLPVAGEAAPGAHAPRSPVSKHERGHETVLVVEDEPALRAVVQRVLSSAGYQVLVAGHAVEALRLADEHGAAIQLVLTDVIMPAMSGRELVEHLAPRCPRAAVIFMSGYTDEAIERYGVLDAEFLRKPFDLRVLTQRVRASLDARVRPAAG